MAEPKTRPTGESLTAFLDRLDDPGRRADCERIAEMMEQATGEPPMMWGSIVGFGRYRYRYDSGREGEWPLIAFSPRKRDLTLYIMPGFERYGALMAQLGRHKSAKSCLYIRKLADVNLSVLQQLIDEAVRRMAPQRIST